MSFTLIARSARYKYFKKYDLRKNRETQTKIIC